METKTDLEMKLEDLLKNVEGVGELEVMIVLKASSEKIIHVGEMKLPEC